MQIIHKTVLAAILIVTAGQVQAAVTLDDFEDGDIAEYTAVSGFAGWSVSGTDAHDGAFGLGSTGGDWIYRDDASVQLAQGDTFWSWIRFGNVTDARAYFAFGASAAGTLSFVLAPNSGDIRFQENPAFGFTELNSSSQSFVADKWYRAEVIWGIGGSLTGNLYDSDGTTLLNTVLANSNLYTSGGIGFRGFDNVKNFDTIQKATVSPAVPEPASLIVWSLLGLTLGGATWWRRRRAIA